MNIKKIVFVLPLILLLVVVAPDSGVAQSPDNFGGLDIIFLVDQSGSMSGCPYYDEDGEEGRCAEYDHPRPNDPAEWRQYSPRYVIDVLGTDALYYHPQATHRIAVINFGTDAYVDLKWTQISPDSEDEWLQQSGPIKKDLKADNLVYTDPKEAIEMANKLFAQMPSLNTGYRKKALILLTDGQPFLPPVDEWYFGGGEDAYKEETVDLLEKSFPTSEYKTCVVAMNDFGSDYWPDWEDYWRNATGGATEGCVRKLEKNQDVAVVFRDLLDELIPQPEEANYEEINIGQVPIDPYLYLLIFTFHKSSEDVEVAIYDPDGHQVTTSDEGVAITKYGPIERVALKRPEPGFWRTEIVKAPEEEAVVRLTKETLLVKAKLKQPAGQVYQHDQENIGYVLEDQEGQIVHSHPKYPIVMTAELTLPDGGNQELKMRESNNQFLSEPFIVKQAGTYQLKVEGDSNDPEGQNLSLFKDEADFEVLPVELLRLEILSPEEGSESLIHLEGEDWPVQLVDARWQVVKADTGQPLELIEFSSEAAEKLFNLKLKNTDTEQELEVGTIGTEGTAFQTQLGDLPKGSYIFEITLVPEQTRRQYNFRGNALTQQISFERMENPAYLAAREAEEAARRAAEAARLKRQRQLTTMIAGGILMALLLILLLVFFAASRLHPARGELILTGVGDEHTIPLQARKRNSFSITDDKNETLKAYGLKKIHVRHKKEQDGVTITTTDLDKNQNTYDLDRTSPATIPVKGKFVTIKWREA